MAVAGLKSGALWAHGYMYPWQVISVRELNFWITPSCNPHPERYSYECPHLTRCHLSSAGSRGGGQPRYILNAILVFGKSLSRGDTTVTSQCTQFHEAKIKSQYAPHNTHVVTVTPAQSLSSLENQGGARWPVDKDHIRNPLRRAISTAAHINVRIPSIWEYLSLSCSNDSSANLGWVPLCSVE